MTGNWRWEHLTPKHAEGLACVICGQTFAWTGREAKAVGSAADTGRPVFACVGACHGAAVARVMGWDTAQEDHR